VAGVALLAIEVLVIPGFGIAGVLGIVRLLAALVLSLIGAGDTAMVIVGAAWRVMIALVISIVTGL